MNKKNNQNNSSVNQLEPSSTVYFDSITVLFIISLLIIDFFPQFGSIEITAPQCLYLSIVNIIMGIFIFNNQQLFSNNYISTLKESIIVKTYFLFFL